METAWSWTPARKWNRLAAAAALLSVTCARSALRDEHTRLQPREELPPISLVTADGVELELLSLEARALIAEPLAYTQLHLKFRNREARTLEGRFRVVLPPSAAIARFAMKVKGEWEEAELVELQQALGAYEMFLHRRQDPALLEHSAGNEFSARVFPIAAHEEKELLLGYSQELVQPDEPYRIALKGLRSPARAKVTLLQRGPGGSQQHRFEVSTERDFEQPLAGGSVALRHGELTVARTTAPGKPARLGVRSLAVLFDTSASRALGLERQTRLLRELLDEARRQGPTPELQLLAFDQEIVPIYAGPSSDFGEAHVRQLLERGALGASNLELALGALGEQLARRPAERVLLIGDGVTTAGAQDAGTLARLAGALARRGVQRIDAIIAGGVQDQSRLAALTSAGLPENGAVLNGERPSAWLWSRLTSRYARPEETLVVEGAEWSWPHDARGIMPGEPMLSVARLGTHAAASSTRGAVPADADVAPLVERAHARAAIAELEAELDRTALDAAERRKELKSRIVQESIAARVLSRFTGLVVLENDWAWRRTGLTVAPTKIISLEDEGLRVTPHARPGQEAIPNSPRIVLENEAMPVMRLQSHEGGMLEEEESDERSARTPATEAERPGQSTAEPAVAGGETPLLGFPRLPPEPDDTLFDGPPQLEHARGPGRQPLLPEPPAYRASDYANMPPAYTGRFAEIMDLLARGKVQRARAAAETWRAAEPGQALALVALGEACRAGGDVRRAARAFGSVVDLFAGRADLRRFAAGRLASLRDAVALELAIDAAWRAVEQRPDHPSGHHLVATLLLEANRYREAFAVLTEALSERHDGRFSQAGQVLGEDLALAAAAWQRAEPSRGAELKRRLARLGARLEDGTSLRFVLTWESDANDVDFHVRDGLGHHAFYATRTLPTGGELYDDVRDGYGPECFTTREPPANRAYPYRLSVRYSRRGPMGYGMGTIQIIDHDGHGGLHFQHRPFVIMSDGGYLDLAAVEAPPPR